MEVKSFEIIGLYRSLEKLANENVSLKTAITLAKNQDTIATPVKLIETRQQELMKTYAKKDDKGEIIQNDDNTVIIENPNEYFTKLEEILNTDIDIELKKIKIDDLGDIKVTANDIKGLKIILEDEDEKNEIKPE